MFLYSTKFLSHRRDRGSNSRQGALQHTWSTGALPNCPIETGLEINLFFINYIFWAELSRGNKPWVLGEIFLVLFFIYFRSGWQRNSFWFAWKQWKVHICSASGWCLQVLFLKSGKVFSSLPPCAALRMNPRLL